MKRDKRIRRAQRERRRREQALIDARVRVTPESSASVLGPPARINAAFATAVDALRQTPESWRDVWAEERAAQHQPSETPWCSMPEPVQGDDVAQIHPAIAGADAGDPMRGDQ